MRVTERVPVRLLARLLPALLCALCAFLAAPADPGTGAHLPVAAAEAPAAPDPHVSSAETAEPPAVVEQSVR
ncbi:hypothetical protein AB0E72_37250, partial [Streptomyces filamentosus]